MHRGALHKMLPFCLAVQPWSTCLKRFEINNSEQRGDEPRCAQPPHHVRHDSLEQRRCQNSAQAERSLSCTVGYQRRVLEARGAHRIAVPIGATLVKNRQITRLVYELYNKETMSTLLFKFVSDLKFFRQLIKLNFYFPLFRIMIMKTTKKSMRRLSANQI